MCDALNAASNVLYKRCKSDLNLQVKPSSYRHDTLNIKGLKFCHIVFQKDESNELDSSF